MASEDRQHGEPEDPAASILGSLPRERPGRRSPRRAESGDEAPEPDRADPEPEAGDPRSVEDLAWAGIAVAAEAATLAVKLANRAIEAMRGTADRP